MRLVAKWVHAECKVEKKFDAVVTLTDLYHLVRAETICHELKNSQEKSDEPEQTIDSTHVQDLFSSVLGFGKGW